MNVKLSIILPVFNELEYIEQCIASLQSNESKEFEVIISDNHSDDGTYEILKSIDDNRFIIIRPNTKLSPHHHHWFAFNHCKGDYVYNCGGDDYFEDGIIDQVLPYLKNDKVCIGQLRSFNDADGSTMSIRNESEFLRKKIFFNDNFINNFLNQISHDEIMFAFVPRKFLQYAHNFNGNPFEGSSYPWVAFLLYSHKNIIDELVYLDQIIIHKRYNQAYSAQNYTKDSYNTFYSKLYVAKSINSIKNCFIYFYYKYDFIGFLKLLFLNRSMERPITLKGGFMGQGKYGQRRWYLGPIFMLLLAPVLDISRILKNIFKTAFTMT